MKWPRISGMPRRCLDDTHYLMWGKQKGRLENTGFPVDKTLLLQHWQSSEAQPRLSRPPLFSTPLALSPGANPLYMPCSSAITMTQFLLKTEFPELQKEPGLVQELLRKTVPLSLLCVLLSPTPESALSRISNNAPFFCPQGYKLEP